MGPERDCICGTPWTSVAASIMSGLDQSKYTVVNTDAIHAATDVKPVHIARIWTNCTELDNSHIPCILNHTSVSQSKYNSLDKYDWFTPSTANEIVVKLKSRQEFALHSYDPDASFSLDSAGSICKQINERAYQWGLARVSTKTRARFEKYGVPMMFEEDTDPLVPAGPLFTSSSLKVWEDTDTQGMHVLKVQAMAFKNPHENWVTKISPILGGYHYCQLLSPARVIEWIQTDGLRKHMGLH
jgi:hypothetical protein